MEKLVDVQSNAPLKTRIAAIRAGRNSLISRLRFWSIGSLQFSLGQGLLSVAVSMPFVFGFLLLAGYLTEGTLTIPSPEQVAWLVGMLLLMDSAVVVATLYTRFPMFAREMLMPVTRNIWRQNVLLSTLARTLTRNCWTWLMFYVIPLAVVGNLSLVWMSVSLTATIGFSVIAAGLSSWVVMYRRVACTACCAVLLLVATVLVQATLSEGISFDGYFDSALSSPTFWTRLICVELVVGFLIFSLAWWRWPKVELAA